LSVGGNDARAAFVKAAGVDGISSAMMKSGVVEDFHSLVSQVVAKVPRTILVLVYHPQHTRCPLFHCLPRKGVITALLGRFSPMYFRAALTHGLPVLDLSRTFNPNDPGDYGSTPIEPSNRSGMYIARLAKKILQTFKWGQQVATVYSGVDTYPEGIVVESVLSSWAECSQGYEEALQAFLQAHSGKIKQKT